MTDAAIIMSGESLFGALTAAAWLNERVTVAGGLGGVLIMVAILLVQLPAHGSALSGRRLGGQPVTRHPDRRKSIIEMGDTAPVSSNRPRGSR